MQSERDVDPTASGSVLERADHFVGLLRDVVRCDAVALAGYNPFTSKPQHELLAADGYPEGPLRRLLEDFVPDTHNPGFRLTRNQVRTGLRWSDLSRDWGVTFARTDIAEEHLLPAGFREGLTACLWLPDGSHVGAVHMNWEHASAATDDRRRIVEQFLPLLAEASNLLQPHRVLADEMSGDAYIAVIGRGRGSRVPGRDVGPTLREDGPLWSLMVASAPQLHGRYLWIGEDGQCHQIDLTPCAGGTVLVAEREVPPPYGLTPRELQIVTHLAAGASNLEVAETLVVSRRTVSTHVEHVLGKLGVTSRSEVASVAMSEGIRLI
jgi:DNA-binding CsgD family transcriptional regulator